MIQQAQNIFRKNGGQLRMSEAIDKGISRYMLYKMRDMGIIKPISRGVYRLVELPPISNPDLVTVSVRFPKAVVCLVSALAFHHITTQIPHKVSVAVPKSSRLPELDFPPVQPHRFSNEAYNAGIEVFQVDRVPVKIYSPEKTLADCFKFRNRIGMDIVLEALKLYKSRKNFDFNKVVQYSKVCRVENVMRPYLEATL